MPPKQKKETLSEEFLTGRAQGIFNGSRQWRTQHIETRWGASNDLYNSRFSRKEKEKSDVLLGQGRLFIPKTYSHTQRMLVDVLGTFFFDPEEVVDVSSWKNVPSEVRTIVKTLINYRLNGHPINFYEEAYEGCLDAIKNKVGIFKVWPKIKTDEQGFITEYAPILEAVPYEDVFFDRQATWKDYWRFPITHRMVRTIDYLKRRGYKNLDRIQAVRDFVGTDTVKQQRAGYSTGSPFDYDVKVRDNASTYVYETWDFLDVNNDGLLESCSYLMAGDEQGPKILIKNVEENALPYRQEGEDYNRAPIVVGNAFPEPHQFYGKDLPEMVEGLQKETNALRNQRREAVALALRKPILVNRGAGVDTMSLVNRRIGGVIMGDDISPGSVREMDISDPTNSSVQEQVRTDQDFFEATSVTPALQGMTDPSVKATVATADISNANKKIQQVIKNLANTLFLPAFRMLLRLEQEYASDDFIALVTGRVLGWGFAADDAPPRQFIQGDFDLSVNIGMNRQAQLNKWIMLADRASMANQTQAQMVSLGVVPPEQVHFIDTMKMYHKMLPIVGEKNVQEYMIQARQPSVPDGEAKGMASQAVLPSDMEATVSNMNPESMDMPGGMLGAQ